MTSVPAAHKYAPGTTISGKYRLERMLGEGGMGSVWAAHHGELDTAFAIKLIRSDSNRQETAVRLLQEARAAAKLGHPAIVRVFDVGKTDQGDPFIVMELLEGESVQQLLAREQRLTATEAVRLLLPIADALRAAHAKGIVHRDIKPDNVFISRDASGGGGIQPKLVDFGIAKLEKRDVDSHLTQKGAVLGSPDYMSPEQARGEEDIDYRADIWSFCVLLYEAISGEPPFAGTNYNALLRAIVETRATTLEERCVADNELSTIVATGMMKERRHRWDSMLDLGDALAVWLLKQGVYEDAAGGSVEAKWITRRTDPTNPRLSRPTFPSEPGSFRGAPGTTTARRLAGEAPTSVGPVVTGSGPSVRRRLFVPGLVALAMGVAAFIGWRAMQTDVPPQKPAALVPVTAAPTVEATPPARPEVPEPKPAASAPSASPVQPKSPKARQRTQSAAPKPGQPKLDLLAPY